MVTLRKPRQSPPPSAAASPPLTASDDVTTPAPADSPGPPAPESPAPPPSDDDALARALAATRHAEEMQRQRHHQDMVERAIGSMPVPDPAKEWLRRNPQYVMDPAQNQALQAAHGGALEAVGGDQAKIGSPEYIAALESGIGNYWQRMQAAERHHENVEQLSDASRETARIDRAVENLEHDAQSYQREMAPPPPADPPPPANPAPAPTASDGRFGALKRNIPYGAPKAQEGGVSYDGRPVSNSTKVTLSPEERDMAHKSMSWLSPAEAEVAYAINKQKMQKMKANGEIV